MHFVAQIPRIDVILTGYWMEGHVRTIRSSLIYKYTLITGDMTIRIILVIQCDMFCGIHLKSIIFISLLGIFKAVVNGRRDKI